MFYGLLGVVMGYGGNASPTGNELQNESFKLMFRMIKMRLVVYMTKH